MDVDPTDGVAEPPTTDVGDRLVGAALDLIAERGDLSFSLRELADAAGTSTMSIYTRFGNREGLYRALADKAFDVFSAELAAAAGTTDHLDAVKALRSMAQTYRRFATIHPTAFDLIFGGVVTFEMVEPLHDEFDGLPSPTANGYRTYGSYIEVFERGRREGLIDPEPPLRLVMDTYWAQVHGLVVLERLGYVRSAEDADERFTFAMDAILAGLGPPGQV